MSETRKRKHSKQYYINSCKKSCNVMDVGLKGFLLTCNNTAKRATQEAFNILNEYADLLYGPANVSIVILYDSCYPWVGVNSGMRNVECGKSATGKVRNIPDGK